VVDDCTDFCWSFFLKKKSDQVDLILDLIKDVKAKYNYTVRYIRCDNAGENTSLEKKCLEQGLGITFEYTSPHSPQFNGRVERKFATLYTKVRCLLNGARVTLSLRHGLWAEAARAATDLENIVVTKRKGKDSHNAFCNKELPGLRNMHTFGEMGIVSYGRDTNKMKPKHMNRGRPCLYLGRAPNHPQDTFRFLNLDTHNIILSRDVTWLNKSYGTWKGLPVRVTKTNEGNEEDEDDWLAIPTPDPEDDNGPAVVSDDEDEDEEEEIYHPTPVLPANPPPIQEQEEEFDVVPQIEDDDTIPVANPCSRTHLVNELKRLSIRLGPGFDKPEATQALQTATQAPTPTAIQGRGDSPVPEQAHCLSDSWSMVDLQDSFYQVPTTPTSELEFAFDLVDYKQVNEPYGIKGFKPEEVPMEKRKDVFQVPRNFEEAWNHPCKFQKQQWGEAIEKEFKKMEDHKV